MGGGSVDPIPDPGSVVAGQVVEHDEVSGPQLGDQHLLDVGFVGNAVYGPVEDAGRDDAAQRQPIDHRQGVSVARWRAHRQPLAARGATGMHAMLVLSSLLIEE